jgi:DNA-binding transcriptional ArsR family regulator
VVSPLELGLDVACGLGIEASVLVISIHRKAFSGKAEFLSTSRMGRPRGSGYRSQVKLLQELRSAPELVFEQLLRLTKLHRNTVASNLRVLRSRGLVRRRKQGRYAFYSITGEALAWRYIERHTSNLAGLFKDPIARRISKACYDNAARAAKPRLRQYLLELSKYPESKPYGDKGIKAAKLLRSYREGEDWKLLQTIQCNTKLRTETATAKKVPLRPTHLLFDSALFRLSHGDGTQLDWLIVLLTQLTLYKWQKIQYLGVSYLHPEAPQEEVWLSEVDGGHWRKDLDMSRCKIHQDYERWKLHEEEYIRGLRDPVKDDVRNVIVNSPLTVIDKKGKRVGSVSYVHFKAEERNGFVNWKKEFGQTHTEKLAQACVEHFRDAPIHLARARAILPSHIFYQSVDPCQDMSLGNLCKISGNLPTCEYFSFLER